jgi:hypothetical protein
MSYGPERKANSLGTLHHAEKKTWLATNIRTAPDRMCIFGKTDARAGLPERSVGRYVRNSR